MPRIPKVYSRYPADCLWCHIPLLEWQQRKTFQPLSCQEGQKMKMVLHPLSVSSTGNTYLPFLPAVGYVPYNTMAHGQKCCLCWQGEGPNFFYLPGCSSEWMVFLLYWGPQFWVPVVVGPRMWFFLTASSVSLWWLLYVLESLCKAYSHSVSAVTGLILLIMSSTDEYAEPNNLVKLVGHVYLHYRMKDTKTGVCGPSVWGCTCVLWWVYKRYRENTSLNCKVYNLTSPLICAYKSVLLVAV